MQQVDISVVFAFSIGIIVFIGSFVRIFSTKNERKIYFVTLLFSIVVILFGVLRM